MNSNQARPCGFWTKILQNPSSVKYPTSPYNNTWIAILLRCPAIQNYLNSISFPKIISTHRDQSYPTIPTVQHSYLTQCWSLVILRSSWTLQGPKLVRKTLLQPLQEIVSPISKTLGTSSLIWLYNTTTMYIYIYIHHVYIASTPKVKPIFSIWTQYTPVIPLMNFFFPCTSASGAWVLEGGEKVGVTYRQISQYKTGDLFYLVDHLPRLGWK